MISSAQVFDTDGYSVEHLFDNEIKQINKINILKIKKASLIEAFF